MRTLDKQSIRHGDPELGEVDLDVSINRYAEGRRLRIDLSHKTEGPWATLTVNEPAVKLGHGEFLVPVYKLTPELVRSVRASDLFVNTGRRERLGYAYAEVWRLADDVAAS